MLVLKFGGTSMGSAQSINEHVSPIVKTALSKKQKPVVVVSAMTGTTNDLITVANKALANRKIDRQILERIKSRHEAVIETISDPALQTECRSYIQAELTELTNLVKALGIIGEIPARSFDAIIAVGEQLSAQMFSVVLRSQGIPSVYVNFENLVPKDLPYKDDKYWDKIAALMAEQVKQIPEGTVPVVTGFFGRTANGIIQDVGRGYSDYCASLLGAGLGSPEIQIWTDVDGVLSANPKVVPEAFISRNVSFDEMAELATFGAKVLHPFSVRPAVNAGIPIRVVNTFNAEDPGTLVTNNASISDIPFKSIACKSGISIIRISTPQMLLAHGFIQKLGHVLANNQVGVDLIATSEVSVTFSMEKEPENIDQLMADLSLIGNAHLSKKQSIISLVGSELSSNSKVLGRALSVLENNDIPVNMLSMSNLRINLSLVTEDQFADKATALLHAEFFK